MACRQIKQQMQFGHMVKIASMTLLVSFMLIMFAGCDVRYESPPKPGPPSTWPPSAKNPPIYPDAQNLKDELEGFEETAFLRTITFETIDEPGNVLDYYKSVLEKAGWEPEQVDNKDPDTLYYAWRKGHIHEFKVKAKKTLTNGTSVEITLRSYTRP